MTTDMTEKTFKSYMNRIPAGEYDADDVYGIYKLAAPKTRRDISKIDNAIWELSFEHIFSECKYGFAAMFNDRIEYIGTNDLHTLMVRE